MTKIDTEADAEPHTDRPGLIRRIGSLLPPGHWFYLLALLVPPMLVALLFQTLRLSAVGTTIGSWSYFDKLHSDIALHLAIIVFWVGAFSIVRRRGSRRALVIALHVFFTALSLMIIMTHLFFFMLDLMPNLASFQLLTLVFQVAAVQIIRAEANAWLVGVAFAGAILANFFPHLVNRRFKPRRISQPPEDPRPPAPFSTRQIVAGTGILCALLLVISALPNISDSTNFTRNRVVSMTMDAVDGQFGDERPAGFVAPTRADIPDQTRLVETPRTKKQNVVFIVLESQGRVSTTMGNPSLDTTPVLAEMAKSGLEASRAFTVVPNTTKSMATSNCGVAPPPDTTNSEARPGGLASKCLASLLGEQGYDTAYFQSATRTFENREKVIRAMGFDDFFAEESYDKTGFSPVNTLGHEDDIMVEPSLDWAKKRKSEGKPFFMEFLTVTAHTKYVLPDGFAEKQYVDDPKHNDYLNAVRYQDRFVGKVVDGFAKAGLADDTIFIVIGDHGEAFREHGRRLHSDVIWTEGLQIPFIVTAPGRWENGAKIDHLVQNMSILPTVVDLLGYKVTGGRYDASSILDAENNPEPRMSHCWNVDQCAAYYPDDRHAYLYFYDNRAPEYYDLAQDPLQKRNIVDTLSDEQQGEYERKIVAWVAETDAVHDLSRQLAAGD